MITHKWCQDIYICPWHICYCQKIAADLTNYISAIPSTWFHSRTPTKQLMLAWNFVKLHKYLKLTTNCMNCGQECLWPTICNDELWSKSASVSLWRGSRCSSRIRQDYIGDHVQLFTTNEHYTFYNWVTEFLQFALIFMPYDDVLRGPVMSCPVCQWVNSKRRNPHNSKSCQQWVFIIQLYGKNSHLIFSPVGGEPCVWKRIQGLNQIYKSLFT